MKLTRQQQLDMLEAAKPLMKWLADNCHPHCEVVVESALVKVQESFFSTPHPEFIEKTPAAHKPLVGGRCGC